MIYLDEFGLLVTTIFAKDVIKFDGNSGTTTNHTMSIIVNNINIGIFQDLSFSRDTTDVELFFVICIVIFSILIGVIFWNHIFVGVTHLLFTYTLIAFKTILKVIFKLCLSCCYGQDSRTNQFYDLTSDGDAGEQATIYSDSSYKSGLLFLKSVLIDLLNDTCRLIPDSCKTIVNLSNHDTKLFSSRPTTYHTTA